MNESFEDEETTSQVETFFVHKESELRFEVEYGFSCQLKLKQGRAEIFGTEMALDHSYYISGAKLAVFTWEGAEIELNGHFKLAYIATETPITQYLTIHKSLQDARKSKEGSRVLIAGPTDSGKSTLSKILSGYATRLGFSPIFIDLDVGQNQTSIPGTVTAIKVTEPCDIVEGFSHISPLCYFYGYDSPQKMEPYKRIVERLAEVVKSKLENDEQTKEGGLIVNTCGWIDGGGYSLLCHAIKTFGIDTILVMGDDRLTAKLGKEFKGVQKISKSGGVVVRTSNYRKTTRTNKCKEYFYGVKGNLSPHSVVMSFSEIEILAFGQNVATPSSLLPIGQQSQVDPLAPKTVEINEKLIHSVLGVSHADSKDQVLLNNVMGFVYVTNIDPLKKEISFLSPTVGKIPKKFLILGNIKWVDQ